MSVARQHMLWLGLLALSCVASLAKEPLLGLAQKKSAHDLAAIRAENAQAAEALRQMQQDRTILEQIKTEIGDDEAKRFLAPTDRLRAARAFERRAAEAYLSHLSYTFAPERKTVIDTASAGPQELAASKISFSADAPTDKDVYRFLETVQRALPGRIAWQEFSIVRTQAQGAALTAANVHVTGNGEWLSNGAKADLAEPAP